MIFQKAKIVGFLKEVGKSGHVFCSKSTSNDHETIADLLFHFQVVYSLIPRPEGGNILIG